MKTNILKTVALLLILAGGFWLFSCEQEPNENKSPIQYLKTVLGGCNNNANNELALRNYSEEKDTVVISVTDDSNIHVSVGLNYTCKNEPFKTRVETIDDVIYMYIEDKCYDDDGNEVECGYERCYCYYTFDFVFKYQGEINQKYKILLYRGLASGSYEPISVFSEGVISSKNHYQEEENYPKEIPFTEYSLEGTSCRWTNFEPDKVIIINSNEELENYIDCTEGTYPEIDFSKHTLLLASGTTPNGIVEISKHLLQLSANGYKLDVEILLNETEMEGKWVSALIVDKLSEESDIELITILKY